MKFEQVQKLQPQLVDRFQAILEQDRLSHAYLFTGDFGSFEMAQLLSQSLFCTDKKGVWPCGTCRACRLIEEDEFSDVTVVRPVNQIIKTDRIRDLIQHFLSQATKDPSKSLSSAMQTGCMSMRPIPSSRSLKNLRVKFIFFC